MKLKRLAQSTVLFTSHDGRTLLVDPGKYNLDPGKLTSETFPAADAIIITHKHADHFDLDLLKAMLANRKGLVLTNEEIGSVLHKAGIPSKVLKSGDTTEAAGFKLKAIQTDHVVRGEFIVNFGVVVSADGKTVYHTSDTRYIDPSLLPAETRAQYLLLPISNRGVVMGIDDALVFSSELKPEVVIPLHYDSPKDKDRVDPKEFEQKGQKFGLKVRVMKFGEEMEL